MSERTIYVFFHVLSLQMSHRLEVFKKSRSSFDVNVWKVFYVQSHTNPHPYDVLLASTSFVPGMLISGDVRVFPWHRGLCFRHILSLSRRDLLLPTGGLRGVVRGVLGDFIRTFLTSSTLTESTWPRIEDWWLFRISTPRPNVISRVIPIRVRRTVDDVEHLQKTD